MNAIGGRAAGGEPALIGEGRGLSPRRQRREAKQREEGEEFYERVFHRPVSGHSLAARESFKEPFEAVKQDCRARKAA